MTDDFTRRQFLRAGAATLLAGAGVTAARSNKQALAAPPHHEGHSQNVPGVVGEVNHGRNGFNPTDLLTDFETGTVSQLETGQTLREFEIEAVDREIEIVPGMPFRAWTFNGRIPGPTLRCTEGDLVRVHFTNNSETFQSLHFGGIHRPEMDGVPGAGPGAIISGQRFTYEFEAAPFGLHLYHSHAFPLSLRIARGLYGAFIVDPQAGRPAVDRELVLVTNGFDLDEDGRNDFYAANTIPFHYQKHPISIQVDETVRLYLLNALEYDPLNSLHLHGNFFHYYPSGTALTPSEYTDSISQSFGQRGILEFAYRYPGFYMIRSQVTRIAELGWLGAFQVTV